MKIFRAKENFSDWDDRLITRRYKLSAIRCLSHPGYPPALANDTSVKPGGLTQNLHNTRTFKRAGRARVQELARLSCSKGKDEHSSGQTKRSPD
jgi:hypothetical protein